MPKISIIIPVYNQAKTIKKCLKSVFNQTFKDFEVIVINDGSTDDIRTVLRRWENKIKIFHQENHGAPAARNFGFKQSRGEYVLFCDADVMMAPNMLEKMLGILEKKKAFAYTYSSFKFGWKKFKLWPFDEKKLKQMPYIHTTSLIRREHFSGFDESLKRFQDWDLWMTLLTNGQKGIWIDEFLFKIKSGGTMSSWLPKFFYRFVWSQKVQKYKNAEQIIKEKHNL